MGELGLDSRRNGLVKQAATLAWQIDTAFTGGCAGAFVFAWTDEWHRAGQDVEDWDFGLTDRNRNPKPALAAVSETFRRMPFPPSKEDDDRLWPFISVVVCSHNGEQTLHDCCEGLLAQDYPHFEVIVVDDGSTDATGTIATEYGFRVIRTPNNGLSSARNTGLYEANGEIVAYTDDDAQPDPHWLRYLATSFKSTDYVGIGGPNIAPPTGSTVARCVANAPGGPLHVLISDTEGQVLVLQEAQACGLPVLATDHNGFPEGMLPGLSGFLVPERDVDSMAEKLAYMIEHPHLWPGWGRAGRAHVEAHYDIRKLSLRLEQLYRQAILTYRSAGRSK